MSTLHLTLKKKWFDMIASGEKKEEYREVTDYWHSRLADGMDFLLFDRVRFVNGYGRNRPTIEAECVFVSQGEGKPEWGAEPGKDYFVIELGKILEVKNV